MQTKRYKPSPGGHNWVLCPLNSSRMDTGNRQKIKKRKNPALPLLCTPYALLSNIPKSKHPNFLCTKTSHGNIPVLSFELALDFLYEN